MASGEAAADPRAQSEAAAVASPAESETHAGDANAQTPEALQARLSKAEEDAREAQDRYLRARADMENYKKRLERTYADQTESVRKKLLTKVLQVKDNLERALQYGDQGTSGEGLMEGVRLTLYQLDQLLNSEGVRQVEAQGKPFNPQYEEALQSVEDPSVPDQTVVQVVRNGYVLDNDHVLRPAQVIVSSGGPEESSE